jgi:hypothetical protein
MAQARRDENMTNHYKNDTITWATFNNIVPIVTSAVMIAISWMTLVTRIELLDQALNAIRKYIK